MIQIGTKIYYCNLTGNVLQIVGDMQGYVQETTFEQDIEIYSSLKDRDISTIGLLKFEFGEYPKLSEGATSVKVNLETKELIFSYDELPEIPQQPNKIEELENKISILEQGQLTQDEGIMQGMMGTAEVCEMVIMLQEQVDAMQPNPVTLNINDKLGGNSAMVEVYANLVLAGKYTVNPEEAINGVKLVPSIYREQVKAKLVEWAK